MVIHASPILTHPTHPPSHLFPTFSNTHFQHPEAFHTRFEASLRIGSMKVAAPQAFDETFRALCNQYIGELSGEITYMSKSELAAKRADLKLASALASGTLHKQTFHYAIIRLLGKKAEAISSGAKRGGYAQAQGISRGMIEEVGFHLASQMKCSKSMMQFGCSREVVRSITKSILGFDFLPPFFVSMRNAEKFKTCCELIIGFLNCVRSRCYMLSADETNFAPGAPLQVRRPPSKGGVSSISQYQPTSSSIIQSYRTADTSSIKQHHTTSSKFQPHPTSNIVQPFKEPPRLDGAGVDAQEDIQDHTSHYGRGYLQFAANEI